MSASTLPNAPVGNKRGRKAKQPVASSEQQQTANVAGCAEPSCDCDSGGSGNGCVKVAAKRGRKPKYVYNTMDAVESVTANSDDDNVILKLNIGANTTIDNLMGIDVDDISVCDEMSLPDAYNNQNTWGGGFYEYERVDKNDAFPDNVSNISISGKGNGAGAGGIDINTFTIGSGIDNASRDSGGVNLKVIKLLREFEEKNKNNEWPNTTSISCYWCCHGFNNTPFGLPINYCDDRFKVYGCFCSLECASAYNFHTKDNSDEVWERNNYINMLSRKIGYKKLVKPAPNRLVLKTFGGYMSIEEFRRFCDSTKLVNINFPPMLTLTQQIEEINEADINSEYKYIPIDNERINKYKERIKLKRNKPITDFKNTLDHAMNLKIDH